jgi:hypothetical protein
MDELPKSLAAVLSEARSAHDPQPDDAQRVAAALSADIPGFQPYPAIVSASPSAHETPRAVAGAVGAGKWLVAVLLLIGAAGLVAIRSASTEHVAVPTVAASIPLAGPHAPAPIEAPRPSLEPSASVTAPRARPELSAPVTARRSGGSPVRVRSATVQPTAPDDASAAPLAPAVPAAAELPLIQRSARAAPTATELPLIQQATRALRDHRLAHAQQLLERHAALFPEGAFKQERIGMLVVTLCEQGKVSEARPLRASLLAEAPDNLLADRMATACDRR